MLLGCLAVASLMAGPPAYSAVLNRTIDIQGTRVDYELVLPDRFDPKRSYPAVLGFGGGPQTGQAVDHLVSGTFAPEAQRRGYIVVVPEAPGGQLFFEGGERIFPEFLKRILATYPIAGGRFHIAGPSNGGISAFYIASLYPQYFISVTGFPGYLPDPTPARIAALSALCLHMFVGQNDELGFDQPMHQEEIAFRARGLSLSYSVEPGQPHRIATLTGAGAARLFDQFDADRHGCHH